MKKERKRNEPYPSARERQHKYYRIYVKNHIAYYAVTDDEDLNSVKQYIGG